MVGVRYSVLLRMDVRGRRLLLRAICLCGLSCWGGVGSWRGCDLAVGEGWDRVGLASRGRVEGTRRGVRAGVGDN